MTPLSDVAKYSKALRRRFWICDFLLFMLPRSVKQGKPNDFELDENYIAWSF